MAGEPGARGPRLGVAEIFWRAAGVPTPERTPEAVVRQALISINAFEEGAVVSPKTGKPMTLMELLADLGIEENLVYASPELARGESIDERSLVFTIGVLMFERLTERHPFGTPDNPERVARIRRCEMGSGVNFFPSVPKDLRSILMRCMGPFPEERYRGLEPLKVDLAKFVGDPQLAASPAKAGRKVAKFFDAPTTVSSPPAMATDERFAEDATPVSHLESERSRRREPSREVAARREPSREVAARREPSREVAARREPSREVAPRGIAARLASLSAPVPASPPAPSAPPQPAPAAPPLAPAASPPAAAEPSPALAPAPTDPDPAPLPAIDEGELLRPEEPDYLPPPVVPASLLMQQPASSSPYSLGPWAPVIYGLLGAGIASLVFVIIALGRGNKPPRPKPTPQPAVTAPAARPAQPKPSTVVAAKLDPRPQPKAQPQPVPEPKEPEEPKPEPKPQPATSGEAPEIEAGRLIAETVRACKVGEGGARSFRIAAYVQPDGKVARALANTKQGLSERQVACIRREVGPLQLKLKLDKLTYIEWRLRIFPDRVEAGVAAPPEIKARVHGQH